MIVKESIERLSLKEILEIYQDIVGDKPSVDMTDKTKLAALILEAFNRRLRILEVNIPEENKK